MLLSVYCTLYTHIYNIYIYICVPVKLRVRNLTLKGMIAGVRWALETATAFSDLSSKVACPIHCSGSCLPWLLTGISLGFVLALLLGFLALSYLHPVLRRGFFPPVVESGVSEVDRPRHLLVDRRARLAAYRDGE